MKPVDCAGGKGVNRAENFAEASKFLPLAFEYSKAGRIVIEPFITGSQHGFCTFLRDQKVVLCCSNNEYSVMNPYRVEIDTFPSDDFEDNRDKLIDIIEKIADILNLKDGIFHMQYILQNGKIYILEVMRRVLGNLYFVPANLNLRGGILSTGKQGRVEVYPVKNYNLASSLKASTLINVFCLIVTAKLKILLSRRNTKNI